jgi:pseudouridine kinase
MPSSADMNSLHELTIACIGGVVLDRKARVIEKLVPGSSNPVTVSSCPGGVVCNIARNLAKLGCRVELFSAVGRDAASDRLIEELQREGLDVDGVARLPTRSTANYTAVLNENGQLFIGLADMAIFEDLDPAWADSIASSAQKSRYWILDANLPAPTIERLLRTHKGDCVVMVDPISVAKAPRILPVLDRVDALFPNAQEAAVLSGLAVNARDDVGRAAAEIRRRGAGTVIVTLGEDGVYCDDGRGGTFVAAIPASCVRDVTGAGDALVAAYAYASITRASINPVLWGLAAASLTVESDESIASGLSRDAILQRLELRNIRAAKS